MFFLDKKVFRQIQSFLRRGEIGWQFCSSQTAASATGYYSITAFYKHEIVCNNNFEAVVTNRLH